MMEKISDDGNNCWLKLSVHCLPYKVHIISTCDIKKDSFENRNHDNIIPTIN